MADQRHSAGIALGSPVAAAINHLLRSASWARERLRPISGRIACFSVAPFTFRFVILPSGEIADAPSTGDADASFTLAPGTAMRMLSGDKKAWQEVAVSGDTEIAREILYIAQNLSWDIEEDLSRVFGDVAAHRMVRTGNELNRWGRETAASFANSLAAYWTEERPLIASRENVERFVRDVDVLRDDVERLEKRIVSLSERHAQNPGE